MAIELKDMLKAGVHFGHKTSRWSPKMRPYIWGAKSKIHLIDISKTAFLLERTGKVVTDLATNGGSFLFVGTKKAAQGVIKKIAGETSSSYVINRWIGGTLSNFDQVKKAITRLLHLQDVLKKSSALYKKKEIVMIQKDIARLERNIGGIIDLGYPPAAVIVVDARKERSAVKEASRLGIPVISMVDTNTNPEGVTYIIPSNDDSPKSISFVLDYLKTCILKGQEEFIKNKNAEIETKKAEKAAKTEKAPAKKEAAPKEKEAAPKKAAAKTTAKAPAKAAVKKEAAPKAKAPAEKKAAPKTAAKAKTTESKK